MKHIIAYSLALILVLAAAPACALAVTADSPLILSNSGDVSCFGTLPLANGSVILSLSVSDDQNKPSDSDFSIVNTWLVCLAPDGSTVWENTFGSDTAGSYTTMHYLTLNGDGTFTGTVRYEIEQSVQYRQKLTFSCADGSVVSEGEKVTDTSQTDKILNDYYPNGNVMLVEEIHNCETTCKPRILRLLDADGSELWALDTADTGLSNIAGWVATEKGALLYGWNYDETTGDNQAIAELINSEGCLLWVYRAAGIPDGELKDAIVDSNGRFVATGFARNDAAGSEALFDFDQLVICLDTETGSEIWVRINTQTDHKLPAAYIAETDGQYVLCTVDSSYTSSIFETLDQNGRETNYWTVSTPEYGRLAPKFFQWGGELWTQTILDGSNSAVLLERVVIPDGQ